jgi:hypothetical protein
VQHRRRSHRFPVAVPVAYALDGDGGEPWAGHLADLSRHGARLSVPRPHEVGAPLTLVLLLDDGPVEVRGRVAAAVPDRESDAGGWMLGIDFEGVAASTADAIVAWCFRHPFGAPTGAPGSAIPAPAYDGLLAAAETAASAERAGEAPAPGAPGA